MSHQIGCVKHVAFSLIQLFFLKNNYVHVIITEQDCPAKGQIYTQCGQDCVATCQNPLPTDCSQTCQPGCHCPNGNILDEIQNACVPLSKCSKTIYVVY